LHKISFFAENDTFALGHCEILQRLGIGAQPRAIGFVRRKTVKRDQSPRHIVGAFMRQEITNQVPAATRDAAPPVLGGSFEFVTLKRIDLITNDTGDHCVSPFVAVITLVVQRRFVYHRNVNVEQSDEVAVARIAGAIGEPARARMLFCLMDGHARTSTELAVVADVSASTASAQLNRLKEERLVKVITQGKHRFYSLGGPKVARVLEGLNVLVDQPRRKFVPNTPARLRAARVCYDHLAGHLGVSLHDQFKELKWLS